MLFVLKECCLVELVLLFARCFASVSESFRSQCFENNQEVIATIQVVGVQEQVNKKKLRGCKSSRVKIYQEEKCAEVV